jgi:putative nucleotidyltransferase with HDIG domain
MLEQLFQITTDISWLEASDLNHPLLRRMTIEAPGTYHHSLVVANLAESAAEAIGANATLCRVCSYFHDVGKLVKPEYFTENMNFERNPHDDLAPTMSALIMWRTSRKGLISRSNMDSTVRSSTSFSSTMELALLLLQARLAAAGRCAGRRQNHEDA